MKRIILVVICLLASFAVKAQDVLVLRSADDVAVKVVMIDSDKVHYKRWSNLEGPTYVIEKSKLLYIKYQNGEKDFFYKEPAPAPVPEPTVTPSPSNLAENKVEIKSTKKLTPIKFDGYIFAGATYDKSSGGPTIDLSLGVNLFEHLYLGAEIGFCTTFEKYEWYGDMGINSTILFGGWLPVGANIKIILPDTKGSMPYINCSLGGWWGVAGELKNLTAGGFYAQVGVGMTFGNFSFNIGYHPIVITNLLKVPVAGVVAHCGCIKLGVRFGK